jgi:hypothetical protein
MVAPGFLQTPRVREWLNGIEPAWTLLDFDSFNALRHEPSRDKRAIRLAVNTSATDIAASPVASNTLTLLHLAEQTVGLKLTAKWDFPTMAFEARILRPLTWFGLLEMRHDDGARPGLVQQRRYRKTPCFDRLISFEVQLEEQPTIRH